MLDLKFRINSHDEMIDFGKIIGTNAKPNMIIALNGDLGSGKTTLTKGIGIALGITNNINSPTFTIMKVYNTNNQKIKTLYHLDVYRIEENSSFNDFFDLEEYFYLGGLSVIEWADRIKKILPNDCVKITINIVDDYRILNIFTNDLEFLDNIKREGVNYLC